jgi:hypothetical protein
VLFRSGLDMMNNYPPGVTGTEPDIMGYDDPCEDCDRFEDCPHDHDPEACAADALADAQDAAYDRVRDFATENISREECVKDE